MERSKSKKNEKSKVEKEVVQAPAIQQEAEVLYIKRGSGRMVLNNRLIKPNEKFYAKPSSIPKAFADLVERVYNDVELPSQKAPAKPAESKFRMVMVDDENSEVNTEINEQIEALEEFDFEDEESLQPLREGLKEKGYEVLADLDKEILKDTILETLRSKAEYNIVNAKGKIQNPSPLSFVEAKQLIESL